MPLTSFVFPIINHIFPIINLICKITATLTQFGIAKFNADQQRKIEDQRQKIQLIQMKQHYLQHQGNLKQSELNREHQSQLELFQQEVNILINDKNLAFQTWKWEQEGKLQTQLAMYNRETQQLISQYQRETALKLPEVNKLYETWPLRIVPSQILQNNNQAITPLKIIIAPPKIDFDKFDTDADSSVPKLEKRISENLRQFLGQHYALDSGKHPVEFIGGAWDAKRFHGESSIKALFSMLNSEPILVIESEIEDDLLNIRFAYWTAGHVHYQYTSVVTGFKFHDHVYTSAKQRAQEWKTTHDLLLAQKKDPSIFNALDTKNLKILEEERELANVGVDVSQFPSRYKLKNDDFEVLIQFLQLNHCLIAGLVADTYYLLQYDVAPLVPSYLHHISGALLPIDLIASISNNYQLMLKGLQHDKPVLVCEIAIDLAIGFIDFKDNKLVELFLTDSINYWLEGHNIATLNNLENLIVSVSASLVNKNDVEYLKKIICCLSYLGQEDGVSALSDIISKIRAEEKTKKKTEGKLINQFIDALDIEITDSAGYRTLYQDAINGRGEAQYNLGDMYQLGKGIELDYSEALKWYRLAAEQGSDSAQYSLGYMYQLGKGIELDYSEALKWYRLAAEQGSDSAQYSLGYMYQNGQGGEKDYSEALKWYALAADQGNYSSQYSLGYMYQNGQGVEQGYSEALKWYRLSAEQGYDCAQKNLGEMYQYAQGVELDYSEALKWYRLSAEQGYDCAQKNLGEMYQYAQGVEQDYSKALKWYRLAAKQGHSSVRNKYEIT